MKIENLKLGKLYGDKDGVNMFFYVSGPGYLYTFVTAEWDEAAEGYKLTDDERKLTESEVKKLIEW